MPQLIQSCQPVLCFRDDIEPSPHESVCANDKHTHHADAEDDARPITDRSCVLDIGTQAHGRKVCITPGYEFGDDTGVPGSAGSGDGARDPSSKDARPDERTPFAPTPQANAVSHLSQVIRNALSAGDDVEEHVPL